MVPSKEYSARTCWPAVKGSAPSVSAPLSVAVPPQATTPAEVVSERSASNFGVAASVTVGGPMLVAASLARTAKKYSSPLTRPVAS